MARGRPCWFAFPEWGGGGRCCEGLPDTDAERGLVGLPCLLGRELCRFIVPFMAEVAGLLGFPFEGTDGRCCEGSPAPDGARGRF